MISALNIRKTNLAKMFEIVYQYGITESDRHYTCAALKYLGKQEEPVQIRKVRWRACPKIGILNANELIDFLKSQNSSTELFF